MNNRNKLIHGMCSHYYCDYCTKKEESVETLDEACSLYMNFNRDEYSSHRKIMRDVVE